MSAPRKSGECLKTAGVHIIWLADADISHISIDFAEAWVARWPRWCALLKGLPFELPRTAATRRVNRLFGDVAEISVRQMNPGAGVNRTVRNCLPVLLVAGR